MAKLGDGDGAAELQPVVTAVSWALTEGWTSSSDDLKVAGQLWSEVAALPLTPELRGEEFLRRLLEAYENTGREAENRTVLARLVLRASGVDGEP